MLKKKCLASKTRARTKTYNADLKKLSSNYEKELERNERHNEDEDDMN